MDFSPGLKDSLSGTVSTKETTGLNPSVYDFISFVASTTFDTYTYKSGGSGGVTVATITISYTDSSKSTISTVQRT